MLYNPMSRISGQRLIDFLGRKAPFFEDAQDKAAQEMLAAGNDAFSAIEL